MATLSRVTAKLFGGNAPLGEIGQFGSAKAGSPLNTQDVATIQALPAYANGWGSAIMTSRNFPPIEEVTGVLKTLSYQNCYTLQEGVPVYDINTNYSATSIVKVVNGTNLSFYVSLVDDNIGNPLSDSTKWAKASFAGREIGEVVTSAIPLTDAGLHLLDGSVLSGNGMYAAFVNYIASIYNSSLSYFCTEAEWQQSISDYGVCGKFVYDSTNNTVRLPKYSNKIYTKEITSTAPVKGTGKVLGLMNGNGTYGLGLQTQDWDGVRSCTVSSVTAGENVSNSNPGNNTNLRGRVGVTTDPTKSGIIADLANITTSLDGYYYIVIATSTKTDIQVDIDEIATDLNGKADTDFTNVTNVGTSKGAGWVFPSDTYIDLTMGASDTIYTAPANGWVCATRSISSKSILTTFASI